MKLKLFKDDKIALLEAIRNSVLDTTKVSELHKVLKETRPDLVAKDLTDAELDQRIAELEAKVKR
jgi:hypothetical protein